MNVKDNQRTRISKIILKNTLLDLLKKTKSIDKITVKDLCEAAELNRSTFYAHYSCPYDILSEIEEEMLSTTLDYLKSISEETDALSAYKYLTSFLQYMKDNDKTFRLLLIDIKDEDFKTLFMHKTIKKFLDHCHIDLLTDYSNVVYNYIVNGSMGVILQWIKSKYDTPIDKMVDLLFKMNEGIFIKIAK